MQKRVLHGPAEEQAALWTWLDLDDLAEVQLTSEDAAHPIEAALVSSGGSGWRAATRGRQSIRLLFYAPQRLRHMRLRFDEADVERTQEFTLRWSRDGGRSFHDVVRQQYTFSPAGATSEVEDLNVDLAAVTTLELTIIPDQHEQAYASLSEWRIA
jgi:hypothetical protein